MNKFLKERIELLKQRAALKGDLEAINDRLNELWEEEQAAKERGEI